MQKVRCSSEIKLRWLGESVVLSEELCVLASCFVTLMMRSSVLDGLRVRRFAVIQEETR